MARKDASGCCCPLRHWILFLSLLTGTLLCANVHFLSFLLILPPANYSTYSADLTLACHDPTPPPEVTSTVPSTSAVPTTSTESPTTQEDVTQEPQTLFHRQHHRTPKSRQHYPPSHAPRPGFRPPRPRGPSRRLRSPRRSQRCRATEPSSEARGSVPHHCAGRFPRLGICPATSWEPSCLEQGTHFS